MEASHFVIAIRVFKSTALMGGDMICLVAFYFILRILFRGVVHMTLVVEIFGVDGDNSPRHPTCLGIPAYMIANPKHLSHLVDRLFFPEAPFSIRSHHCAPRHVHCRRG